ncbi:MAG TPA: acetyl-CoA carboxylase biotin carboxyl carrier protein [Bryobacteraceae bacterium]|nr:acetyl-CoA carboxylase biotin carboxyl carrier protein [Bryobacteraceae bacterium]
MTIDEIKELIQLVNESGIAELEVARGDNRVRIRRSNPAPAQEILLPSATPVLASSLVASAPAVAGPVGLTGPAYTAAPSHAGIETPSVYVKSPIVGTFYEGSSPGAPPFVKPGDRISVGQVLCIIESMKLMNEIESDVAGTLSGVLVENGQPVEYGEALFAIQPA